MSPYKKLSRCTTEHQGVEIEYHGVVKPCHAINSYLGVQLKMKVLTFWCHGVVKPCFTTTEQID